MTDERRVGGVAAVEYRSPTSGASVKLHHPRCPVCASEASGRWFSLIDRFTHLMPCGHTIKGHELLSIEIAPSPTGGPR